MAEVKKGGTFGSLGGAAKTAKTTAEAVADKLKAQPAGTAKPTASASTTDRKVGGLSAKPAAAAASAKPTVSAAKPTVSAAKPTVTAAKPTAAVKSKFTDVPADAIYYDAVNWAVSKGITSGTSETTFSPDNPCHRGHCATFLWRALGSPAPKGSNPFSDVKEDSPFYKAILWASENKFIPGKTDTEFGPTDPCNRSEVFTFLYRTQTQATASPTQAAAWSARNKLTEGQDGNVNTPATRADIVLYLYRVLGKK